MVRCARCGCRSKASSEKDVEKSEGLTPAMFCAHIQNFGSVAPRQDGKLSIIIPSPEPGSIRWWKPHTASEGSSSDALTDYKYYGVGRGGSFPGRRNEDKRVFPLRE